MLWLEVDQVTLVDVVALMSRDCIKSATNVRQSFCTLPSSASSEIPHCVSAVADASFLPKPVAPTQWWLMQMMHPHYRRSMTAQISLPSHQSEALNSSTAKQPNSQSRHLHFSYLVLRIITISGLPTNLFPMLTSQSLFETVSSNHCSSTSHDPWDAPVHRATLFSLG